LFTALRLSFFILLYSNLNFKFEQHSSNCNSYCYTIFKMQNAGAAAAAAAELADLKSIRVAASGPGRGHDHTMIPLQFDSHHVMTHGQESTAHATNYGVTVPMGPNDYHGSSMFEGPHPQAGPGQRNLTTVTVQQLEADNARLQRENAALQTENQLEQAAVRKLLLDHLKKVRDSKGLNCTKLAWWRANSNTIFTLGVVLFALAVALYSQNLLDQAQTDVANVTSASTLAVNRLANTSAVALQRLEVRDTQVRQAFDDRTAALNDLLATLAQQASELNQLLDSDRAIRLGTVFNSTSQLLQESKQQANITLDFIRAVKELLNTTLMELHNATAGSVTHLDELNATLSAHITSKSTTVLSELDLTNTRWSNYDTTVQNSFSTINSQLTTVNTELDKRTVRSGSVTLRTGSCKTGEFVCAFADESRVIRLGSTVTQGGRLSTGTVSFSTSGNTDSKTQQHHHVFGYEKGGTVSLTHTPGDQGVDRSVPGRGTVNVAGAAGGPTTFTNPSKQMLTEDMSMTHFHSITLSNTVPSIDLNPKYQQLIACCSA
jgi:hypothetical protein